MLSKEGNTDLPDPLAIVPLSSLRAGSESSRSVSEATAYAARNMPNARSMRGSPDSHSTQVDRRLFQSPAGPLFSRRVRPTSTLHLFLAAPKSNSPESADALTCLRTPAELPLRA